VTKHAPMAFMDHLGELRDRMLKVGIMIVAASIAAFFFHDWILELLAAPFKAAVDDGRLAVFRPGEGFSLVMRLSLFGGIVLSSPVILYQTWRFVSPALSRKEKRWILPLMGVLTVLFGAGITLGYWALARGLEFLLNFGGENLEPVIGADNYLAFAMRFILAFGIAFEFPVFLFVAAAAGLISSRRLREGRRWAVLIILIAAALITPSGDPLTLMLLSVPLYAMFEATVLAIRFIIKK
jgi:sec-independent protein translocase protein TatC